MPLYAASDITLLPPISAPPSTHSLPARTAKPLLPFGTSLNEKRAVKFVNGRW